MFRLIAALWDGIRAILKGLFWIAVVIVLAKIFLDKPTTTQQSSKSTPALAPLDFTAPVYTKKYAIICPMSLFSDPRVVRDVEVIRSLWTTVLNRSSKVKEMGCEEWRDGVPVAAKLAFPENRNSIVIINETMFTQQMDVRN